MSGRFLSIGSRSRQLIASYLFVLLLGSLESKQFILLSVLLIAVVANKTPACFDIQQAALVSHRVSFTSRFMQFNCKAAFLLGTTVERKGKKISAYNLINTDSMQDEPPLLGCRAITKTKEKDHCGDRFLTRKKGAGALKHSNSRFIL